VCGLIEPINRKAADLVNGKWKTEKNCLPKPMQYWDQHDNEYEAKPTAAVVAGPVEGAASKTAKASE
jgi:hypothetical protein